MRKPSYPQITQRIKICLECLTKSRKNLVRTLDLGWRFERKLPVLNTIANFLTANPRNLRCLWGYFESSANYIYL